MHRFRGQYIVLHSIVCRRTGYHRRRGSCEECWGVEPRLWPHLQRPGSAGRESGPLCRWDSPAWPCTAASLLQTSHQLASSSVAGTTGTHNPPVSSGRPAPPTGPFTQLSRAGTTTSPSCSAPASSSSSAARPATAAVTSHQPKLSEWGQASLSCGPTGGKFSNQPRRAGSFIAGELALQS